MDAKNGQGRLHSMHRAAAIFGVMLGMFVTSLNTTVIAPALTIIATDLGSAEQQAWIATAYLLAFVAVQALAGKFSDIFGRKPILLLGLFCFVGGSLISALTPSMPGLIAGRTIQGLGAGSNMSMSFVLIIDLAPVNMRPRFQSALVVIFGLANVVGTLIGGVFVDRLSWRWDFWFNVILASTAFVMDLILLKETVDLKGASMRQKLQRIDFLGTFLVIGFVCCLLLALSWGNIYGWSSGHSIGPFVAAGVTFLVLAVVESRVAKEPVVPPELLLNPSVSLFYLFVFCFGLGFVSTLYYGPIMYQAVFGAASIDSGIRLVPYMSCLIVSSVSSSIMLSKFPYVKFYIVVGAICNIVGFGLFYTVDESSNWGQQACYIMLCGLAFGLSQQNALFGVQAAAPLKYIAVATGLAQFFLMLSSAVGVAICDALFRVFLKDEFSTVDSEILAVAVKYGANTNYLYIRNMPLEYQQPIIHLYMTAIHKVFTLPLTVAGIAVVCAVFIKNVRYGASSPSSSQAKQQSDKSSPEEEPQQEDPKSDDTSRTLDIEDFADQDEDKSKC